MFPATAPAVWAAACAHHGQETPLSLACRLGKRGLLRTLALHGVPAAGSMLAALQLQDEAAAAALGQAVAPPLPLGVVDAAEELALQRRQWTRLYASKLPDEVATLPAGKPGGAGAAATAAALAGGLSRHGHESPSSVLGLPSSAVVLQRKGSETSEELAELPADVLAAGKASHPSLPVKGRRGLFSSDDAPPLGCCSEGPTKCLAECSGTCAEKAAAQLTAPGDAAAEGCSGRWHVRSLFKVRPSSGVALHSLPGPQQQSPPACSPRDAASHLCCVCTGCAACHALASICAHGP